MGRSRKPCRKRVGRVSYYFHHGGWYIYYRDGRHQVRRRVAEDEQTAAIAAAEVNAQLAANAPTQFSFCPISVPELRRRFLDHHEHVRRSSLGTVRRYRSATQHLIDFVEDRGRPKYAHQIDPDEFVRHLRNKRVPPNGHPNAKKKRLCDKTACFIVETCRSLYGFAGKKRHLPPYVENPFSGIGGKHFHIEDAKFVYVFDAESELAFLRAADEWSFAINFTLAKTGLRTGELIHLLIEEVDLDEGWLHVHNKPDLGWRIKTRRERSIPLVPELAAVIRRVIGNRAAGPVFLRQRFDPSQKSRLANTNRKGLVRAVQRRIETAEKAADRILSREDADKIARTVWQDAGALIGERIRKPFIRIAESIGLDDVTCPKSWRHTFATLLQDANVDPLIRQITLGHAPSSLGGGALGMTSIYTHTRPETQKTEIERAMRLWPKSLQLASQWSQGGAQ